MVEGTGGMDRRFVRVNRGVEGRLRAPRTWSFLRRGARTVRGGYVLWDARLALRRTDGDLAKRTLRRGEGPMSTQVEHGLVTAEQLLRMPDDGFRYELVEGELCRMTPGGGEHGYLALELGAELRNHVKAHQLGRTFGAETGFRLASDPDTVRAADAAFVRRERADEVGRIAEFWPGAPDLAVEVISPRDSYSEVHGKALEWLEAGSRMVVVVDPRKRTITCYRSRDEIRVLTEEDVLDGAEVVPGWKMRVGEVFE
jgi:Uma2 family endonuclease